jgi:hypothetical protein
MGHGVIVRREETHWVLSVDDAGMRLGVWWLESAQSGALPFLPVVNLNPKYEGELLASGASVKKPPQKTVTKKSPAKKPSKKTHGAANTNRIPPNRASIATSTLRASTAASVNNNAGALSYNAHYYNVQNECLRVRVRAGRGGGGGIELLCLMWARSGRGWRHSRKQHAALATRM